MYRGTTPNIIIKVNSDIDLASMTQIWATFKSKSAEKTYDITKLEINTEEKTIGVIMSQADTLAFQTDLNQANRVEVQLRLLDDEGIAYASGITSIPLYRILKEGVIE